MVGVRGGGIPLVGGRLHLLLRAPHPCLALREGPLVPPWQGGLLGEAVVGHLLLVEGRSIVSEFLGAPLKHGGGDELKHTCCCPWCVWCTIKRASNL